MTVPLRSPIRIGTRSSALALRQAGQVESQLAARGIASVLVEYTTLGDRILDRPLAQIGEKGLFTAELEADLRAGRIDCAVHSLKDLPTADPEGIVLVAILEREDPRDALVVRAGVDAVNLETLPEGARVGTSSLRRQAQLRALRPDLEVCELRGNVGTRLRKLDEGQMDAALLAAAGLRRLGLTERIVALLDAPDWLAAPGQGAIAVQTRADDAALLATLGVLDDAPTRLAVTAERALLAALEGGCQVPIGAAVIEEAEYGTMLHGLIAALDGSSMVRGGMPVNHADPAASGIELARQLRAAGGDRILAELR
ncbi:hydroxymethylbilane synthase [Gemmatimonas aurantiaca]|uniref:hydroxymethylbilane synthase n=1 Tax=Gemmatimonas aurantiaca TaxID=173480 RepID=UPI00301DD017